MKKTFLALASALIAFGASALQVEQPQRLTEPAGAPFGQANAFPEANIVLKAPAKAAETALSIDYSPAYGPSNYTGLQGQKAGMLLLQAFQMTKETVNKFAGNDITDIYFYTGLNEAASKTEAVNTIQKATVFLAESLEDFNPFYTQTVELSSQGLTLADVKLEKPYTLEANKPVYVGYYYVLSSEYDLTIIYDAVNHGNDISGGYFGIKERPTTEKPAPDWEFTNVAQQVGFLCIGTVISGDKLPQNEAQLTGAFVQPTVYQNDKFDLTFAVRNDAANGIESLEVEVKVGDNPAVTETFSLDQPLGYKVTARGQVKDLSYATASLDDIPVSIKVTKVNGQPNNITDATATTGIQVIPAGQGFTRNVLVEEFTGAWCGYCPTGYVTMEKLREIYTDGSVIPVAVHYDDVMAAPSFQTYVNNYATGFPSAIMNRQMYIDYIYPTENCVNEIEDYMTLPAPAKVTATAAFTDDLKGIKFETKSSFAFDNDKASEYYTLAFAVTEDNVGPYEQNNNYAGQKGDNALPGWSDKPSKVKVTYNDVARQYNSSRGITGSVPEQVKAGEEYTFSYEMKFLATSKIANKLNLNAVVYLVNRKNGVVENAYQIKADVLSLTGVDNVEVSNDADAPVEYFNLQGIRVEEPAHGLYIRRQGSKASTVLVR